jgi:hypothetical protein
MDGVDRTGGRLGKLRCDVVLSRPFAAFRRHMTDQGSDVSERDKLHHFRDDEQPR